MNYIDLHNSACAAAQQALDETFKEHGDNNPAFNYCGFAWITIPAGRKADESNRRFVQSLEAANIGALSQDSSRRTWRVSVYDIVDLLPKHSQSMYLKEIAAGAYARYLKDHGVQAFSHSRDD